MAKVVGLKIEVDGFTSVIKNLKEVDSLVGQLGKSLLSLSDKGIKNITTATRAQTKARKEANETLTDAEGILKKNINSQGELKQALRETRKAQDGTDFGTEKFRKLETQMASLKNVQKQLRDDARKTQRELELEGVDPSSLRGLELQYTKLRNQVKLLDESGRKSKFGQGLISEAARVRGQLNKLNQDMNDFRTNIGNYQSAFGGLLGGFRNLALTIGAGFGISEITQAAAEGIRTFADFDQQVAILTGVLKTSKDAVTPLREEIIRLGSETQFTASQAAEAATNLARAGFSQEEIVASLDSTLKGAISTGEDLTAVSDVVAKGIRGLGLSADESGRFVDVLTETLNTSNNRLENYREALKVIAPVSNALGISAEETSAAIGLLGDNGLQGTDATTTLSSALSRLSDDTKKYAKAAKDAGIEVFNQNGEFVGLSQLLANVEEATQGYTDQQRQQTISQIFGIQAVKQFTALLNAQKEVVIDGEKQILKGSDALAGYTKQLEQSSGAADDAAGVIGDTLQQDFLKLQSAVEGATIKLIEGQNEGIRGFVQELTELAPQVIASLQPLLDLAATIGELTLEFSKLGKQFGLIQTENPKLVNEFSFLQAAINALVLPFKLIADTAKNTIGLFTGLIDRVGGVSSAFDNQNFIIRSLAKGLQIVSAPLRGLFNFIDERLQVVQRLTAGFQRLGDLLGVQKLGLNEYGEQAVLLKNKIAQLEKEIQRIIDFGGDPTEAIKRLAAAQEEYNEITGEGIEVVKIAGEEQRKAADKADLLAQTTEEAADSTKALDESVKAAAGSLAFYEAEISRINSELKNADPSEYATLAEELAKNEEKATELRNRLEEVRNRLKGGREFVELEAITPNATGGIDIEQQDPAEALKREAQLRAELEKQKETRRQFLELSRVEQLEAERQLLNDKLLNADIEFQERLRIADELAAKELEIEREKEAERVAIRKAAFEEIGAILQDVQFGLDALAQIGEIRTQNQLNKVEETYQREIELAGENEEAREAAELKFEEAKRKIDEKAFKRNQQFAITQAIINGALAATQALANTTLPFPISLTALIPIAIQTGLQVATIRSQKFQGEKGLAFSADDLRAFAVSDTSDIPSMASGGTVTLGGFAKGKRHSQGGIHASFHGVPVEIEDGEFVDVLEDGGIAVINRKSSRAFAPELKSVAGKVFQGKREFLSKINQRYGGVSFQDGGVIENFSPPFAAIGRDSLRRQGINLQVDVKPSLQLSPSNLELIANAVREGSMEGAKEGTKEGDEATANAIINATFEETEGI